LEGREFIIDADKFIVAHGSKQRREDDTKKSPINKERIGIG
jgi:hypothetical protein